MAKGNLYTHIVKRGSDKRIEILSFLKQAWRTKPRDMEYINRLREELKKIDAKQKHYPQRKKLHSAFDWVKELSCHCNDPRKQRKCPYGEHTICEKCFFWHRRKCNRETMGKSSAI